MSEDAPAERARVWKTPPGVALCAESDIADPFPLAVELDRYLTPDGALILCGWHGAVFDPLSGACTGGPCAGGRLTPWPVEASGGVIRTA